MISKGDVVSTRLGGGGGWGNPGERDPESIRRDVIYGYVSIEGAKRDYGVVINPNDLEVDQAATAEIRATQFQKN
jgi:N-methylhydantoinase B